MNLILKELKKIFNIKSLAILGVIGFIIFNLFIQYHIDVYPYGSEKVSYDLAVDLVGKYGNVMDDSEFEDFKLEREKIVKDFNKYLSSNENFVKKDLDTYEKVRDSNFKNNKSNEEKEKQDLRDYLYFDSGLKEPWLLQNMDSLILEREGAKGTAHKCFPGYSEIERFTNVKENKSYESILDRTVFNNYDNFISGGAVLILISIVIILAPIYSKDKSALVDSLQHSSKIGRNIYKTKMIAGTLAAFIVSTLYIIIGAILYSSNNTGMFFESNINSFMNELFWVDMTFGQYIILTVILLYILSMIIAFLTMFLSSIVSNHIKLMILVVPIVGAIIWNLRESFIARIMMLNSPQYKVPLIYGVLILITLTLTIFRSRQIKKLEV